MSRLETPRRTSPTHARRWLHTAAFALLGAAFGPALPAAAQPAPPAPAEPAPATEPPPPPETPPAPPPTPSDALTPPPAPPPPPPATTPNKKEGARDPDDVFLLPDDDPRIPTFLRALRAGKDSLMLGGWIRPGFTYVADSDFNDDDTDGFDFDDARLIGYGDLEIYEGFGASFRFNFDVNRGNFAVRDTYGSLTYKKDLIALDIGQLKTPLGMSLIQSQSKMQFPINTIIRRLAFGRDLGVQARSDFNIGQVWFHLAAMMANGEGGFRQRRNLDNEFVYVGRLEISPFERMERSESDLKNSDFQLSAGFSGGHNSALTNDLGLQDAGASETKIQGDLRMWFKGASIRGEYLHGFRSDNDAGPGFERYGLVVQAGYVLPIPIPLPLFEIVARYQQADVNMSLQGDEDEDYVIDNTETRVLQFGANAYFAKHAAKLQVMYQLTDLLEGQVPTGEDVPIGDAFVTALHCAWL
jgi:hypothetical protein